MSSPTSADRAVPAFLFGNFVIGTGVLILPGMLNQLADGLSVSLPMAGYLIGVGALVMAFGAPLVAALTSRIDRRMLLVTSLMIYSVGHALCALAPDFKWLMPLRAITVISAAIFTPQVVATIGMLVPIARRASAVTTIFLGWSIASVAGMPIGNLIASYLSWRAGFGFVAVLALVAAIWVMRVTPKGLSVPPMSLQVWRNAFGNRSLMLVLLVTLTTATAQFTLMAYLAPSLLAVTGSGPQIIAALMAFFGVCGVIGNTWVSRRIDRNGPDRSVSWTVALMLGGLLAWALISVLPSATWPLLLLACALWGLGCFSTNSAQQARLVAVAPALASVSIALNTSGMYAGQAIGSSVGGAFIAGLGLAALPWVAAALMAVALEVSRRAAIARKQ